MILQHFFVCSEEVSEERRGVERAPVHHEDKKPRNGKNLQERKGREKPTETFHFENKDVGRWSEDYLAIGNIRQPRAVQFAVFASPGALSSTYTRTEVFTQSAVRTFKVRAGSERVHENNEKDILVKSHRTGKDKGVVRVCVRCAGAGGRKTKGWFLVARMAPPRQKAAEKRNFSPKARVRAVETACHTRVRRSKDDEATGVKRTGAERERWW